MLHFSFQGITKTQMNSLPKKWSQVFGIALLLGLGISKFPELGFSKPKPKKRVEIVTTELKIRDCHDGDTCLAETKEGIKLKLRLLGIDAPEVAKNTGPKKNRRPGQAFGNEARDYLNSKVKNSWVKAELHGSDAFSRYLSILYENPVPGAQLKPTPSINQVLVEEGFAFAYRGSGDTSPEIKKWAMESEDRAKKAKKGLWSLEQPPERPEIFRRSK